MVKIHLSFFVLYFVSFIVLQKNSVHCSVGFLKADVSLLSPEIRKSCSTSLTSTIPVRESPLIYHSPQCLYPQQQCLKSSLYWEASLSLEKACC
uniref:Secreted protein n=1 Tax=Anguilla anguilla TaxID=7936 RepID=A0A0E9XGJ8_ANGAN